MSYFFQSLFMQEEEEIETVTKMIDAVVIDKDIINLYRQLRSVLITEHIQQMGKGQDHCIHGSTVYNGIYIKYAAVFDGHGSSDVINFIRNISTDKMEKIMATECPITTMFHYVNECIKLSDKSSGSTMCVARIFSKHIEIINSGDSQAIVYKNDKIEFISDSHDALNDTDLERVKKMQHFDHLNHADNIKMIDEHTLCVRDAFYIVYDNNTCLICSQCLGHNGITGIKPDKTIINYTEEDNIRVLLGSDGLFDMIIKEKFNDGYLEQDLLDIIDLPGGVILNRAIKRWMQPWSVCDLNNISEKEFHQFEKQDCDDVCLVIIDILL